MATHVHVSNAKLAETGLRALRAMCEGGARFGHTKPVQMAADAGALEAILGAMRAHPREEAVQGAACRALTTLSYSSKGTDAAAITFSQRARQAGAIELIGECIQAFGRSGTPLNGAALAALANISMERSTVVPMDAPAPER
jgi:hypothetical protein